MTHLSADARFLLALPALLGLGAPVPAGAREAPQAQASSVEERHVEVEGRTVRALCTPGPVEALLIHGEEGGAEVWLPVLRSLAGQVGACAYDRPARGEPGAGPGSARGWFELLDDLAEIHGALAEGRPVLVGHGVGGLYARLYALDRPVGVSGLVLVEPVTEGELEDARRGMPEAAWRERAEAYARPNVDGVRVADLLRRASGRELREGPVTVVTATRRPEGDGWVPRWLNEAARRHQGALAEGPRPGRHVPAPGSGWDVPREAPGLVAEEIVRAARLGRR